MGYTGTHKDNGISMQDFFQSELAPGYTILKSASVSGVFYAAMRTPDGNVEGIVAIVHRSKSYYNITYKLMSEKEGPVDSNCPAKILDLLDATDDGYALAWRARCRANLIRKTGLVEGATLKFKEPLNFGGYGKCDTFRLHKVGRTLRFDALRPDGTVRFICRLPKDALTHCTYTITPPKVTVVGAPKTRKVRKTA